jgi:Arc/MetJ-type ribon-helix-helix transcriptional regulator
MIYVTDQMLEQLDEWRATLDGEPSRSDAVRRALKRVFKAEMGEREEAQRA